MRRFWLLLVSAGLLLACGPLSRPGRPLSGTPERTPTATVVEPTQAETTVPVASPSKESAAGTAAGQVEHPPTPQRGQLAGAGKVNRPEPTEAPTPLLQQVSGPEPTPTPEGTTRPQPCAILQDARSSRGLGVLTVKNELNDADALVVLVQEGQKSPLLAFYIWAADSCSIEGIADGTYELYYMLGWGWQEGTEEFARVAAREKFEDVLAFTTEQREGGVAYTQIEVTLYAVLEGNAETTPVPAEEFPRLG